jgi:hypothetical protein
MQIEPTVGIRVKSKGYFDGLVGTIVRIVPGESIEWHGTIEIVVEENNRPDFWNWVKVGDLEHFCHYNWDKDLEIVKDEI